MTGLALPASPLQPERWQARLDLSFARRDDRTVLVSKLHRGPLQIQKALYPEGSRICHATLLHPPGGLAGGDDLRVGVDLAAQAQVCLTTPGATKWYRCPAADARQALRFSLQERAWLEWLPRESILFDAARSRMHLQVDLAPGAQYLGWEILCLGRRASGETWSSGDLYAHNDIRLAGKPLWSERAQIQAASTFQASAVGMAGYSVSATLAAAGSDIHADLLRSCRSMLPIGSDCRVGVTTLPKVLLARYLGHSSQQAFDWFSSVWRLLRPALLGLAAVRPRLWAC